MKNRILVIVVVSVVISLLMIAASPIICWTVVRDGDGYKYKLTKCRSTEFTTDSKEPYIEEPTSTPWVIIVVPTEYWPTSTVMPVPYPSPEPYPWKWVY